MIERSPEKHRSDTDTTPGKIFKEMESEYGRFVIYNDYYKGERARIYEVDGTRESATFFGEKKYDPVFDYVKCFSRLLEYKSDVKNMLMIGGAGFQYPKYVISRYPDIRLDVVEINPVAVELAREYFYLDDLERDFKAESSGRLKIIIADGMQYLKEEGDNYDIIINDAYHSNIPDKDLSSLSGARLIGKCLNPGGLYCLNLITSLTGAGSMPFNLCINSLKYCFYNVNYFTCSPGIKPDANQNVLFICKDPV